MFEEENSDDWLNQDYQKSLASFDEMFNRNEYLYLDSDNVEFILHHLIITNQLKKAKWAAEQALEHFPNNSGIIIRQAQVLSMIGEINTALNNLIALEQIEPNNNEVLISIALCYSQLKHFDQSIKYYKKALAISSDDVKVEIALDLAMEYENKDDYSSAIQVLKSMINEGHYNEMIVYEMAHCYERLNDNESAIKTFLEFIDEDPYSFTTWYNLGNSYAKLERTEEAIWAYEYAILIQSDFVPAMYNIANAYLDANKISSAIEYYKKCLEIDKNDPMVFCSLGECYEELDEFETAYEMYHRSTDLLPQLADAWLGKGIMSDLMGNHTRGVQELLIAVDLEPDKGEYWRMLANAYENANKQEQALSAYEKAIDLEPDDKETIIDYLSFLAGISIEYVFEKIEEHQELLEKNTTKMVLSYCHWMIGNHSESMILFDEVLENDTILAKSLFLHFPEMRNVTYFVNRLHELDQSNDNEEF